VKGIALNFHFFYNPRLAILLALGLALLLILCLFCQRLSRLLIGVRAFARILKMEGREEQGAAPRQAPRGQGGAADPADPDDPDRRRRLAELRQRILHRMVRIILGYHAAYCRANKACGRVCPNRVSESTIEHEAHRILHEDFYYDDVADSDVESLTNRL
jgi:hypothetical protein